MNDFTQAQVDAWIAIEKQGKSSSEIPEKYRSLATTSDRIRAMFKDGYTRGAIARALGKRPQHVHNVLNYELKRQG